MRRAKVTHKNLQAIADATDDKEQTGLMGENHKIDAILVQLADKPEDEKQLYKKVGDKTVPTSHGQSLIDKYSK